MYVALLSDTHLEYFDAYPGLSHFLAPSLEIDIICLCGDIGDPSTNEYRLFLTECATRCKVRTFVIMGNHETHHRLITETERMISNVCAAHEKLTFLNRTTYDLDEYRFIGTTLWTKIAPEDTVLVREHITDFRYISKWGVSNCTQIYHENVAWITEEVRRAELDNKRIIVLTHHVPVMCVGHPQYDGTRLKTAFATDLKTFIENTHGRIVCWFYGHDHCSSVVQVGETWVASNQYGKEKEETGFDSEWVCVV